MHRLWEPHTPQGEPRQASGPADPAEYGKQRRAHPRACTQTETAPTAEQQSRKPLTTEVEVHFRVARTSRGHCATRLRGRRGGGRGRLHAAQACVQRLIKSNARRVVLGEEIRVQEHGEVRARVVHLFRRDRVQVGDVLRDVGPATANVVGHPSCVLPLCLCVQALGVLGMFVSCGRSLLQYGLRQDE